MSQIKKNQIETIQNILIEFFFNSNLNITDTVLKKISNQIIKAIDAEKELIKRESIDDVKDFVTILNGNKAPKKYHNNTINAPTRFSLILEELCEYAVAHGQSIIAYFISAMEKEIKVLKDRISKKEYEHNPKNVLDALIDLRYVCDGAIVEHGLYDKFKEAFKIVHTNNMEKGFRDINLARQTSKAYTKDGCHNEIRMAQYKDKPFFIVQVTYDTKGRWTKGKVLKPINHPKPDLKQFINI